MGNQRESLYVKYNYQIGFTLVGVATCCITNYRFKKPLFSGIQRHFLYGGLGFLFGTFADRFSDYNYSERDARVRHFVETYPEEFNQPKRKYKEIFDEWYPVR